MSELQKAKGELQNTSSEGKWRMPEQRSPLGHDTSGRRAMIPRGHVKESDEVTCELEDDILELLPH